MESVSFILNVYVAVPVGQIEKSSSSPNSEFGWNVEAEKPHARPTVAGHIGSNVDFREVGNRIESRAVPKCDTVHVERDDGDPCFAFIEVDIKRTGDPFSEILIVDFPMEES